MILHTRPILRRPNHWIDRFWYGRFPGCMGFEMNPSRMVTFNGCLMRFHLHHGYSGGTAQDLHLFPYTILALDCTDILFPLSIVNPSVNSLKFIFNLNGIGGTISVWIILIRSPGSAICACGLLMWRSLKGLFLR